MPGAMLRPEDDRDILAASFETEYEEVHNLKNFYKRVYEMLEDEGWKSADSNGKDANFETLYFDKTTQDGAQFHHIWWRAIKIPEKNSYYRYFMKVDFQTLYMKKHELVIKGQKISSFKGSTIMRVSSYLQLDYDDKFKNSSFINKLERKFRKRIYFAEVEKAKRDLYLGTYRFHTLVKQFMGMKPIIADWGRPFHPERGGVQ